MIGERTKPFPIAKDTGAETKQILREIYLALSEKGYDPINQIGNTPLVDGISMETPVKEQEN